MIGDSRVIRLHPQFFNQEDVIVSFGHQFSNGFHPLRLVLAAKQGWHSPGVESNDFEALTIEMGTSEINQVDGHHMAQDDTGQDAQDEGQSWMPETPFWSCRSMDQMITIGINRRVRI